MNRHLKLRLRRYGKADYNKDEFLKKYYLDHLGNAVIRIQLQNIEDAFSKYSPHGYEELDNDLSAYIDGVIYNIPLKNPIVLQFIVPNTTAQQQQRLREVFNNFYGLRFEDKKQDLTINLLKVWGLFFVGAALLIFSYFLSTNGTGQFFTDFMNIAGTFALWEVVDMFLLERRSIKFEKLNAGQAATAQIIFSNEN